MFIIIHDSSNNDNSNIIMMINNSYNGLIMIGEPPEGSTSRRGGEPRRGRARVASRAVAAIHVMPQDSTKIPVSVNITLRLGKPLSLQQRKLLSSL